MDTTIEDRWLDALFTALGDRITNGCDYGHSSLHIEFGAGNHLAIVRF